MLFENSIFNDYHERDLALLFASNINFVGKPIQCSTSWNEHDLALLFASNINNL